MRDLGDRLGEGVFLYPCRPFPGSENARWERPGLCGAASASPWSSTSYGRMMSDRLPKGTRRNSASLESGVTNSAQGSEGHGGDSNGDVASAAPVEPGLQFLRVPGVLRREDYSEQLDSGFCGRWPALWEFVTRRKVGITVRETSTLLFFREDGRWKCCLCDRDSEAVMFRAGDTIEGCLDALEESVTGPRPDWRASRRGKGR